MQDLNLLDDRAFLTTNVIRTTSSSELYKLCLDRWHQSRAAQARFPSAQIYAIHLVGLSININGARPTRP